MKAYSTPIGSLVRRCVGATVFTILIVFSGARVTAAEPLVVPVWDGVPPGSEGKQGEERVRLSDTGDHVFSQVHRPTLTVYLPAKPSPHRAAVLVIPGGGHREIWMDHEGYNVARWLSDHGVAAFILKYRLAREPGSTYTIENHSLADAQRAMRLIRSRATEWSIDPERLGVIGFSAGGELAWLVASRSTGARSGDKDVLLQQSDQPAFQALIYPGHADAIAPRADLPPAFLACGYKDRADISEGLAKVYLDFKKVNVPAELHIYSDAGHGFGLRATDHSAASKWIERFYEWLGGQGIL